MRAAFDHAVIIVRDRLDELAPAYAAQGYTLSERATHNLGSCNRLIVLDSAYIELLGWPPGAPPRPEIADLPMGLDALVFRTDDAQATYQRLKAQGYAVNPVQTLSRPARLDDGSETLAQFQTVRFAEQPVPGLRLYFCQHLTPQCVWRASLLSHANGARHLARIDLRAPDARALGEQLGRVIDVTPEPQDDTVRLVLDNVVLHIQSDASCAQARPTGLAIQDERGGETCLRIAA